jgi:hypothetical protein
VSIPLVFSCQNVDHVNINMCDYDTHDEMVERLEEGLTDRCMEEEREYIIIIF